MARTPNPDLHLLWRDRVCRQRASGLTIVQFCEQEGIARSKFHAWKRRLRITDAGGPGPTLPARPAFLPVAVRVVGCPSDELPPIEADLPNGVHLRIPTSNARLACWLVRVLAGAKTNSGGSR
jgi:putative transposase